MEVPDPPGGSGPPAAGAEHFSLGTRGDAGPVPRWGAGPGPFAPSVGTGPLGLVAKLLKAYHACLCLDTVGVGTPVAGY